MAAGLCPYSGSHIGTDVHITQSYARVAFGEYLRLPPHIYTANRAGLYLTADAPYHQDGTRLDEAWRNALDLSHRATLNYYGIPYHQISGSWPARYQSAISIIDAWLAGLRFK